MWFLTLIAIIFELSLFVYGNPFFLNGCTQNPAR